MSDYATPRADARTGGPKPRDRKDLVEQVVGWTLAVLVAMFVVRAHLM